MPSITQPRWGLTAKQLESHERLIGREDPSEHLTSDQSLIRTEAAVSVLRRMGYEVDTQSLAYLVRKGVARPRQDSSTEKKRYLWRRRDIDDVANHLEEAGSFTEETLFWRAAGLAQDDLWKQVREHVQGIHRHYGPAADHVMPADIDGALSCLRWTIEPGRRGRVSFALLPEVHARILERRELSGQDPPKRWGAF